MKSLTMKFGEILLKFGNEDEFKPSDLIDALIEAVKQYNAVCVGEDDRLSEDMATGENGKEFMLIQMNINRTKKAIRERQEENL